ncbi:ABC transporter substrate-binding protein [Rhodopseudomonas sp. HC1]|uniref:ABC transporter substrate-binding protein n=1 Tax=Rhodopseudomonas infernalis TaxID=2897386 RepID=UPI001EE894D4|nr:ABC transporter substrate-binding protein [Rhodopseudomonas infernalis]MCG6205242.1 ABC transporter substrate-binding protein [Rhodopseudomonas infernalis]
MTSHINRRVFLGTSALAAIAAGTSLGFPSAALAQEKPKKGGVLVATWGGFEPQAVFVPGGGGSSPLISSTKILEPLLRQDSQAGFLPVLATEVKPSADFKSYDIVLRKGVTWHDGKPFTADDVVFSIEKYWLQTIAKAALKNFSGAEVTEGGVRVSFKEPTPEFFFKSVLATSLVIPKHVYDGSEIVTNPANNAPIGTGPFKFKQWVRGSHIEYAANDKYWDAGKPYLNGLVMRYWRDAASRTAALEADELQLGIFNPIPTPDIDRLSKSGKFVASNDGYLGAAWASTIEFNSRRDIVKDPAVRRALLTAIDRATISDVVYFGRAKPGTSFVSSTNPKFYNPNLPRYEFDAKKAAKMLDDAGYPKKGKSRFKVHLLAAGWFEENGKVGQFVKQNLEDIGVEVTLTVPDRATSLKQIYGDYDYDIALSNYAARVELVPQQTDYLSTSGIVKGAAFRNATGYSNPEVDDIVAKMSVESDEAKRKDLAFKLQEIAARDLPITVLVELIPTTMMSKKVKGVGNRADISADSLSDVWLDV